MGWLSHYISSIACMFSVLLQCIGIWSMELNIVIKKSSWSRPVQWHEYIFFWTRIYYIYVYKNKPCNTYIYGEQLTVITFAFSNIKWVPETFYGMFLVPALQGGGRRAFFCFNIYKRVYRLPCPFYVLVSYLFYYQR